MLKKKDLQEKLKKIEELILTNLHLYGKNSKRREETLVKDLEKYFKLKSTQGLISFQGCSFTVDAKKFDDFVKQFSMAETNFYICLFTTNRFKRSFLGNIKFEALIYEDYYDLDTNVKKREKLLKANEVVFFLVTEFIHAFVILVRNSKEIFEGKPAQITLFDSALYYDEDLTKRFVRNMYGLEEKAEILYSKGKCPK